MNLENSEWGIATLSVQANIPNTLPGQAVTFLLLGDAQVENSVAPDEAFQPVDPVEVTVRSAANLRAEPLFDALTVVSVEAGTLLPADGRSADEDWLRVVYQERVLWVSADAVDGPQAMSELPVLTADQRASMQAFYFTTGVGETQCNQAPSLVAVNSPENLRVGLSVNGADISLGSLITLQNTAAGGVLTVIEGSVETEDGLVIPAGQASDLELDEDGTISEWGEPRPINEEEFAAAQTVQQAMFALQPDSVSVDDGLCAPGETTTHTVVSGENLFRIALRYNSTVADIAAANNLTNVSVIFVGQELIIPCGTLGAGESPLAGVPQPPPPRPGVTASPAAAVCAGLRQTSPLGGFPNGPTPFYWDGVAQATSYSVLVYDETGALVATFPTQGAETSVVGDMSPGTVGRGTNFSWAVQAFVSGVPLCATPPLTMPRDAFPQQVTVTSLPPVSLFLTCPASLLVSVNWANVTPGSLISWSVNPGAITGSTISAGSSGSQVIITGSSLTTYSGTMGSTTPSASSPVLVTCP
ncbi:MAG: LysM peptidoglycan-binding domain-containing protein [Chloroflexi bacterium]|nr:LysM peptidoglycan-binding domain-containing protein [Chloroflexota bacterium]